MLGLAAGERVPADHLAGFFGSLFLGGVAAVVFLLAYQPTEVTVVTDTGATVTSHYSGLGLVAVSLVVGVAGSSVLSALTRVVTKAAEAVKLGTILTGLQEVQKDLEAGPGGDADEEINLLTAQLGGYVENS